MNTVVPVVISGDGVEVYAVVVGCRDANVYSMSVVVVGSGGVDAEAYTIVTDGGDAQVCTVVAVVIKTDAVYAGI